MTTTSDTLDALTQHQLAPPKIRDLRKSNRLRMSAFGFTALFFGLFGAIAMTGWIDPTVAVLFACSAGALIAFADALYIRQMDYTIDLMAKALADSSQNVNDVSSEFVLPESSPVKEISRVIAERDGRVREMVFRVRHGIFGVSCHAAQLARSLEDTAKLAQQQRGLAEKVFTASETNHGAVTVARQQATDLEQATSRQRKAAEASHKELKNALARVNDMETKVKEFHQTVKQLEEHSQDISQVVAIISGISDQTNLLALNASIEASSAGEAGKGFAVVATEVRSLAEQVKQATQNISDNIERMTAMVGDTRKQTSDIHHHVDATADVMHQASERFEGMVQEYMQMGHHIAQASDAIISLSDTNSHIHTLVSDIHGSCGEVSNRMSEGEQYLVKVSQATERIQELASSFQVGSDTLEHVIETLHDYRHRIAAIVSHVPPSQRDALDIENQSTRLSSHNLREPLHALQQDLRELQYAIVASTQGGVMVNIGSLIQHDSIAKRALESTRNLLMQTYSVDGTIYFDLATPISIGERHWGVLRIGFQADSLLNQHETM